MKKWEIEFKDLKMYVYPINDIIMSSAYNKWTKLSLMYVWFDQASDEQCILNFGVIDIKKINHRG